jgi:hypothetical protein
MLGEKKYSERDEVVADGRNFTALAGSVQGSKERKIPRTGS